ncbi:TetR/AcrR family transcriptional regulator [Ruminococcus sp. OA3]|uniref:TetR/AcrR family transcriptional regulator n=1 Tax=Ruminococcus sp. OA3 TaxID=2914164 RepID=UPI001F06E663|nr:TetR/AcrR family transcriptional regulator [Ruminococcus sp. OA3]MCH1983083.1 TetR/AcrR family transcriptional regulator [Ruminococcus sp. OA3]
MQNNNKRDLILDAMQELMNESSNRAISVSDIAEKAGIGKGSIYYYFESKNDIIEAVIERSYSMAIRKSKELVSSTDMDAFAKMEIIFRACLEASSELKRQEECGSFIEIQQSALIHQKFMTFLIKNMKPILSDIIRQGVFEGLIQCDYPDEIAEIVLIVMTVKLDNHIIPSSPNEIRDLLYAFSLMQSKSMGISMKSLQFLQQ